MDWTLAAFALIVILTLTLGSGQWIAIALAVSGVVLLWIADGFAATGTVSSVAWNSTNSFILTAVPLFILMGEVVLRSGISEQFYRGVLVLFRKIPGGALHTNVAAAALFSAISGSSVATAATVGTVAIPEANNRNYDRSLTLSTLAGGGSLGQLIPPSVAMLVYASQVEVSVSRLFAAGFLPGLALTGAISIYVIIRVMLKPSLAPRAESSPDNWLQKHLHAIAAMLPVVALLAAVLGVIYAGWGTPTEAAGLGAATALLLAAAARKLNRDVLSSAIRNTVRLSCMVLALVVGAQILAAGMVRSGMTRGTVGLVSDLNLSPFAFFAALILVFLLLGCVVDSLSLMLLTLPVIFPLLSVFEYDLIWFGVVMMIFIELGQLTPPVGMVLYVLKGVAPDSSMGSILRAAFPVQAMMVGLLLVLYFFPDLALWLPEKV